MKREVVKICEGWGIEKWTHEAGEICDGSVEITMLVAVNDQGDYIGTPETARDLVEDRGIAPQLRADTDKVCSIGFCVREQKWYGWRHRAIFGFGIGDSPDEGWAVKHFSPGFVARNMDDARRMAEAYAQEASG